MQNVIKKSETTYRNTYTGKRVHAFDPDPDTLVIEDIAHALSLLCRYGGHTKKFYSVAEHCIILSHVVSEKNTLWALLHDAAEAYFGDLGRPIKNLPELKPYRDAEEHFLKVIMKKFGLPLNMPKEVRDGDNNLLYTEAPFVLKNFDLKNPAVKDFKALKGVKIQYLSPEVAEKLFLKRFNELFAN